MKRLDLKLRQRSFAAVGLALSLLGCGGVKEREGMSLLEPVALDRHVVWFDRSAKQVLFLDVGAAKPTPKVERAELDAVPQSVQRRNGSNELLSLLTDDEKESTELVVVTPKGVDRRYDLETRWNSITQSEDGRYAIAHYSADTAQTGDTLLFNANEMAIIDLSQKGDGALTKLSLKRGSNPRWLEFTPELNLAGEKRRLLVVVYAAQIALLDLNHLDRPAYTVEFSQRSNIQISKLRFSADENKIYALAQGSTDVYVVPLLPSTGGTQNDFVPSISQLGADAYPLDMVPYGTGKDRRLLVVSGNSAQIVEASSSRVTQIPLQTGADHVLLFEGSSPFDPEVEQRALLYAENQARVSFLDLDDVEERTTRNLEELSVPGGIAQLVQLDEQLLLALQKDAGVNVINLQERTASQIQAQITLNSVVPSLPTGRLWVAPEGSPILGFIDVDSLHPAQVRLDNSIQHLFVFNDTNPPRVAAVHPDFGGSVSVLNAADPSDPKSSVTLAGFFFEGALDQ